MKPIAGLLVITACRCPVLWWTRQRVHLATPTLKRGSA
jgi:hypothetical protein